MPFRRTDSLLKLGKRWSAAETVPLPPPMMVEVPLELAKGACAKKERELLTPGSTRMARTARARPFLSTCTRCKAELHLALAAVLVDVHEVQLGFAAVALHAVVGGRVDVPGDEVDGLVDAVLVEGEVRRVQVHGAVDSGRAGGAGRFG